MISTIVLASVALLYLLATTILGRYLVYNDLKERPKPSPADLEGYSPAEILFESHDGLTLRGWFVPATRASNGATVVVLHGWHRDRSRIVENIRILADGGFNVLAYDQRGHGSSDTGLISFGPLEGRDCLKAIEYVRGRQEVDSNAIGLVAFSLGTSAAVYALATGDARPPVRCAVLEGVFSVSRDVGKSLLYRKYGRILGAIVAEGFFTVGAFLASLGRFRDAYPVRQLASIAGIPLLIIRGQNDHMVPEASAIAFIEAAPGPKEVWYTKKGGHYNTAVEYPEEYKARVIGFLRAALPL